MEWSLYEAKQRDEQDVLREMRHEFYIREGSIYLDGNSLGLLSKRAEASLLQLLNSWKEHGIDGWTEGEQPWFYFAEQLGQRLAPFVGAKPHEVIATGSITSNLHQMLATFYKPTSERYKIVVDELNFPTDLYVVQSVIERTGRSVEDVLVVVKADDKGLLHEEDILQACDANVAVLLLSSVLYRSGQLLNMEFITKTAQQQGIIVGWDLAHSIGSVPHSLHDWNVDFSVWCNYKHMNGGPGAVGGLFVHERHFPLTPALRGWFGSDKTKQFDMSHSFTGSDGIGAVQLGTPHIFSMAPLLGSLELFEEATIENVRRKSLQLTTFLRSGIETELKEYGFTIVTPKEDAERGGHVYVEHADAARICKALKERGIVPDFRKPNGIRFAPVALYNSFEDVWNSVQILKDIMEKRTYEQFSNERGVIA